MNKSGGGCIGEDVRGRQIRKRWAACCSGFQKVRSSKTSAFSLTQPDRPGRNSPLFQPKQNGCKKGFYQP